MLCIVKFETVPSDQQQTQVVCILSLPNGATSITIKTGDWRHFYHHILWSGLKLFQEFPVLQVALNVPPNNEWNCSKLVTKEKQQYIFQLFFFQQPPLRAGLGNIHESSHIDGNFNFEYE